MLINFAAINVTERTASIGKDVSRQYSEQVQFNPGTEIYIYCVLHNYENTET
jgi:hypothetical protein